MSNDRVMFIYGTLKYGYQNNDYLAGADFLGDFEVNKVEMIEMSYMPGLIIAPEADKNWVKGELWQVSNKHIEAMDRLEGHPRLFERVQLCWYEVYSGMKCPIETYMWKGFSKEYPRIYEWTKKPITRANLL